MSYTLNAKNVPTEALGYPGCIAPMAMYTSAARLDMFSSHITQAMTPLKRSMPGLLTGMELNTGKQIVNEFAHRRKNPVHVIAVARKGERSGYTSQVTAIVMDIVTKEVRPLEVHRALVVSKGNKGLQGYTCTVGNLNYLTQNAIIPPDVSFCSPRSHEGNRVMRGIDVPVAYVTRTGVTEDAILISDKIAQDMAYDTMRQVVINITPDYIPINQFGKDGAYQIFPHLGEVIHEAGSVYLYAARLKSTSSALADQNDYDLCRVRDDDILFQAAASERIVDVDYISTKNAILPDSVYHQVNVWRDTVVTYLRTIADSIQFIPKDAILTPEYLRTHADALKRLAIMNDPYVKQKYHSRIQQNKLPVDVRGFDGNAVNCVQLLLTIAGTNPLKKGDKVTDRSGTKGVISAVVPRHLMPVDEFGHIADMLVMAPAIPNRGNPGQLHECMINKTTWIMTSFTLPELAATKGYDAAFDYIIEFLSELRPPYAECLVEVHPTHSERMAFVTKCIHDKVIPVQWPAGHIMDAEEILRICTKFGFKETPVTLSTIGHDPVTGEVTVKKDKSQMPMTIGGRYCYVLNKSQDNNIAATSVAKVGGHGQPIGASSKSGNSLIGTKPIRTGEDEDRICRSVVDPSEVSRLTMLHANSPYGVQKLVETILTTEHPENIERVDISNEELARTNSMLQLLNAVAAVQGVTLFQEATEEDRLRGLSITSTLPSMVEADKAGEE